MEDEYEPSFTVAGGGKPLTHFVALVSKLNPTDSDMITSAKYLVEKTRSQALSGFDVNGTPFAPYSPGYQKAKKQSHVDLYGRTAHQHMLDELKAVVTTSPPSIEVGIIDNEELALRARVNDGGLTFSGRQARAFIKKLKNVSHQKKSGLKRQLKNRGNIQVIPPRPFLGVTPQDIRIMGEMIADSIVGRLNS